MKHLDHPIQDIRTQAILPTRRVCVDHQHIQESLQLQGHRQTRH